MIHKDSQELCDACRAHAAVAGADCGCEYCQFDYYPPVTKPTDDFWQKQLDLKDEVIARLNESVADTVKNSNHWFDQYVAVSKQLAECQAQLADAQSWVELAEIAVRGDEYWRQRESELIKSNAGLVDQRNAVQKQLDTMREMRDVQYSKKVALMEKLNAVTADYKQLYFDYEMSRQDVEAAEAQVLDLKAENKKLIAAHNEQVVLRRTAEDTVRAMGKEVDKAISLRELWRCPDFDPIVGCQRPPKKHSVPLNCVSDSGQHCSACIMDGDSCHRCRKYFDPEVYDVYSQG